MDQARQQGRRRNFRGKRSGPSAGGHGHAAEQTREQTPLQPELPGVATPTLTEAIPPDTPRFADLNASRTIVDPVLIETITKDLRFDHMMPVQAATIHQLLPPARNDCLVQAKTGTGKTLGFLLPAIQTMLNRQGGAGGKRSGISLLVLAPTRELAMQIAKEATNLLQRMPARRVCIAVGGTNKNQEERQILAGCDILIATPGRLIDHVTGTTAIKQALGRLDTLVLDEADRLLDMGFLGALQSILACLPSKSATQWQGMLFSATVPSHVAQVADLVLAAGYKSISTIPAGEAPTHARVMQLLIQAPSFAALAPALIGAIRQEKTRLASSLPANAASVFKAIVFAPTAALADFYGLLLANLSDMPPSWTLHARHAQSKRTNITSAFRGAASGILVATDVVARGMDFPAVTTVFQVGIPMDKESYIHRLGRTARGAAATAAADLATDIAAAQSRGVFIISADEAFFPRRVLQEIQFVEQPADLSCERQLAPIIDAMDEAMVAKTYQAWLGYYKSHMKPLRWDKDQLVASANSFARDGLHATNTPAIQKSTVGKMGLRGTPGLVVVPDAPRTHHGGQGGGGGRGGGGGGGRSRGGGGGGGGGGRRR
ncbi:ATP-dependent RNA helicase mitochondrial precursor [Grosmannia clavigera kw1407]|uniref:ATP-dependent RNA helicase n=1 Tax=Grosmannia clavigera (strain kw1407 / UAMH 11150) TaxID=655863 RepID=F0X7M5_GROCL|nr:ATP-dependent RNA helicase mitochondrial precursor [Grosmannia clavigera kw1407]EFX06579.1 ATP-dependent RNA helicase mitochondrial precursor [Grosmannia clavigera kw1407]